MRKPKNVRKEICRRIAQIRTEKDLNQNEMSEIIGMTQAGYSAIETGRVNPSFESLIIIAEKFGLSYNWIFMGEGQKYLQNISFIDHDHNIKVEFLEILKKETEKLETETKKAQKIEDALSKKPLN